MFAASRNLSKMEGLSEGVHRIELDVNSEASTAAGVDSIIRQAGRIDILVNNAGQGFVAEIVPVLEMRLLTARSRCVAPLLEVDMDRLRQTFNVNVG